MIQMFQRDNDLAPNQHIIAFRNRDAALVCGLILMLFIFAGITVQAGQGSVVQVTNGVDIPLRPGVDSSLREGLRPWQRDFSSAEAYEQSIAGSRERFRAMIGAIDDLVPVKELEMVSTNAVGETDAFTVYAVRWAVFAGVHGEGLLLQPKKPARARVVALPDADQTPEMLAGLAEGIAPDRQFARRLAENGCEVLVPVLVDRSDTYLRERPGGSQAYSSHREWIRRLGSPIGRHIIGYEVQKVRAAVSYLQSRKPAEPGARLPLGIAGFGEGGLIAFYAAAIDRRVEATLVSGYFDNRQSVFAEPAYRDVFGLLKAFGDAEIATLIAPRHLIVEHSPAPANLVTADYQSVETEFERARALLKRGDREVFDKFTLISGTEGMTTGPGSDRALTALLNGLGFGIKQVRTSGERPVDLSTKFAPQSRQHRQIGELETYSQTLLHQYQTNRGERF